MSVPGSLSLVNQDNPNQRVVEGLNVPTFESNTSSEDEGNENENDEENKGKENKEGKYNKNNKEGKENEKEIENKEEEDNKEEKEDEDDKDKKEDKDDKERKDKEQDNGKKNQRRKENVEGKENEEGNVIEETTCNLESKEKKVGNGSKRKRDGAKSTIKNKKNKCNDKSNPSTSGPTPGTPLPEFPIPEPKKHIRREKRSDDSSISDNSNLQEEVEEAVGDWISDILVNRVDVLRDNINKIAQDYNESDRRYIHELKKDLKNVEDKYDKTVLDNNRIISKMKKKYKELQDELRKNSFDHEKEFRDIESKKIASKRNPNEGDNEGESNMSAMRNRIPELSKMRSEVMFLKMRLANSECRASKANGSLTLAQSKYKMLKDWIEEQLNDTNSVTDPRAWKDDMKKSYSSVMEAMNIDDNGNHDTNAPETINGINEEDNSRAHLKECANLKDPLTYEKK